MVAGATFPPLTITTIGPCAPTRSFSTAAVVAAPVVLAEAGCTPEEIAGLTHRP